MNFIVNNNLMTKNFYNKKISNKILIYKNKIKIFNQIFKIIQLIKI